MILFKMIYGISLESAVAKPAAPGRLGSATGVLGCFGLHRTAKQRSNPKAYLDDRTIGAVGIRHLECVKNRVVNMRCNRKRSARSLRFAGFHRGRRIERGVDAGHQG